MLDVSVLEHEASLDSSIDSLWYVLPIIPHPLPRANGSSSDAGNAVDRISQFETMLDDFITSESKWSDFWKALFSREAESLLEDDGNRPPNAMNDAGDCKSGLDKDNKDMDDAGEGDIKALAPPSFTFSR